MDAGMLVKILNKERPATMEAYYKQVNPTSTECAHWLATYTKNCKCNKIWRPNWSSLLRTGLLCMDGQSVRCIRLLK